MNSSSLAAEQKPAWMLQFCGEYTPFLFSAGKWMIVAGIVLGIVLALANVYIALRPPAGGSANREGVVPPTAVLDAIRAFIQALTSAPTWFALFGGGVLLLWMAGNAVPEICKISADNSSGRTRSESSAQGGSPAAAVRAPAR